jgi:hypothetical protein
MRKINKISVAILFTFVFLYSGVAFSTTVIGGLVTDDSGAPVEGVRVAIDRLDDPLYPPGYHFTDSLGSFRENFYPLDMTSAGENFRIEVVSPEYYIAEPEFYEEFVDTGSVRLDFDFVVTIDTAIVYRVRVIGMDEHSVTSYDVAYRHIDSTIWESDSADSSGIIDLEFTDDGLYLFQATKEGHVVEPTIDTITLDLENLRQAVYFDFTRIYSLDYHIRVFGRDSLWNPISDFEIKYKIGSSPRWNVTYPGIHDYVDITPIHGTSVWIIPFKEGLQSIPDTIYTNLEYADAHQEHFVVFRDSFPAFVSEQSIPKEFAFAAYPNPFNSSITIEATNADNIVITDIAGRHITTLPGGVQTWQPAMEVPSGIYIILLKTPDTENIETQKILYIK